MKIQRRFAPTGGLFRPESVAGFARIRSVILLLNFYKGKGYEMPRMSDRSGPGEE